MPNQPLVVILILQIRPGLTVVLVWRIRKPSPEHRWGLLLFHTFRYIYTLDSLYTFQTVQVKNSPFHAFPSVSSFPHHFATL
jgi:predicted small integral membrane protein